MVLFYLQFACKYFFLQFQMFKPQQQISFSLFSQVTKDVLIYQSKHFVILFWATTKKTLHYKRVCGIHSNLFNDYFFYLQFQRRKKRRDVIFNFKQSIKCGICQEILWLGILFEWKVTMRFDLDNYLNSSFYWFTLGVRSWFLACGKHKKVLSCMDKIEWMLWEEWKYRQKRKKRCEIWS